MTTYRQADRLLVRRCADLTLVLAGGQVHTLRGVAADLFDAVATDRTVDQVVADLAGRYDVVPAAEVQAGLEALRAAAILQASDR